MDSKNRQITILELTSGYVVEIAAMDGSTESAAHVDFDSVLRMLIDRFKDRLLKEKQVPGAPEN